MQLRNREVANSPTDSLKKQLLKISSASVSSDESNATTIPFAKSPSLEYDLHDGRYSEQSRYSDRWKTSQISFQERKDEKQGSLDSLDSNSAQTPPDILNFLQNPLPELKPSVCGKYKRRNTTDCSPHSSIFSNRNVHYDSVDSSEATRFDQMKRKPSSHKSEINLQSFKARKNYDSGKKLGFLSRNIGRRRCSDHGREDSKLLSHDSEASDERKKRRSFQDLKRRLSNKGATYFSPDTSQPSIPLDFLGAVPSPGQLYEDLYNEDFQNDVFINYNTDNSSHCRTSSNTDVETLRYSFDTVSDTLDVGVDDTLEPPTTFEESSDNVKRTSSSLFLSCSKSNEQQVDMTFQSDSGISINGQNIGSINSINANGDHSPRNKRNTFIRQNRLSLPTSSPNPNLHSDRIETECNFIPNKLPTIDSLSVKIDNLTLGIEAINNRMDSITTDIYSLKELIKLVISNNQ